MNALPRGFMEVAENRPEACAIRPAGGCNRVMDDDSTLLRRYVIERSEQAFAALVQRTAGLVYSAALRQVGGDMLLAQDVSQSVFVDLARRAPTLVDRPVLASWLYTSTRFAALKALREEHRRHAREHEAQAMQAIDQDSANDAAWQQVRPLIDEVICDLPEADHSAILMRYFENQPFAVIGEKLGIGESSARMRADRALDKVRLALAKKGITSTAAALGLVLASKAVAAPPAGAAAAFTVGALAHSVALGGGTGALVKASKLSLLHKTPPAVFAAATVGTAGLVTYQVEQPADSGVFLAYAVAFGVGLLFTLVSAVIGHAFGGHGDAGHDLHGGHAQGHAEGGGGSSDMPGFAPLSPTTIASFITAFGGFGMIFSTISATSGVAVSAPLAALGGLLVAAGVFGLFNLIFRKTQGSSEGRVSELASQEATVISPIAAGGVGEIAYIQGGTRYTAPARVESNAAVAKGTIVRITRIVGTEFYVTTA